MQEMRDNALKALLAPAVTRLGTALAGLAIGAGWSSQTASIAEMLFIGFAGVTIDVIGFWLRGPK